MTAVEWNPELYADNTAHHRAYDDHVIAALDLTEGLRVLDIGSGAGDFSAKLAASLPMGSVLGIDSSGPLVEGARARFSRVANLSFEELDARDLARLSPGFEQGRFDLVISVAALHWVPAAAHPALYRDVHQLLTPGGAFRADFGGSGQIAAVRAVLDEEALRRGGKAPPWHFPTAEQVAEELGASGFALEEGFVRLVTQRRSVPDAAALRGWLDSQVLIAYRPSLGDDYEDFAEHALRRLESEVRREDGTYDQDYVRVDLLVHKPTR